VQEHGKLWQLKDRQRDAPTQAGLTRWHIGEIASRIGQIYYEYYNRTSDSRFLKEACVWYDTIRKRQYFKPEEPTEVQVQQQLRYYMRFTLVCILLQETVKARHCSTVRQHVWML
jgi:Protein SCAI